MQLLGMWSSFSLQYHSDCMRINYYSHLLEFFHIRTVFDGFSKSLYPSVSNVIFTKTTCTPQERSNYETMCVDIVYKRKTYSSLFMPAQCMFEIGHKKLHPIITNGITSKTIIQCQEVITILLYIIIVVQARQLQIILFVPWL